jgi:hypothetical protein
LNRGSIHGTHVPGKRWSIHRRRRHKSRHWGMTSLRCRRDRTLLVADNKTIVPRARGATGNAVKSKAWDENEVLLEGEELVTWCSIRSLWASEASGPGGDAACARAGRRSAPPIAAPSCVRTALRRQRRGWRRTQGTLASIPIAARLWLGCKRKLNGAWRYRSMMATVSGREGTTKHRREGSTGYRPNGNQARSYEFLWRRISLRVRRS